jgi:peptidoglycan/LPS O-acetylase OafA/YrhL
MKRSKTARDDTRLSPEGPSRLVELDILKGLAIISVILIHTWYAPILLLIGAPYHIWHAVPLFILIAGYTSTYAYMRHGSGSLAACYDPALLFRRLKRIYEPFLVMWVVQILVIVTLLGGSLNVIGLASNFLMGGSGPGSYYIPVIVQHILVVPVLFLVALRYPRGMLAAAFVLDLFFELLVYLTGMNQGIYAVLYFRYLFAGALGVYLGLIPTRFSPWVIAGGVVGFVYLTLTNYLGWLSLFLQSNIESGISHAPAYFWTFVLAVSGLTILPKRAQSGIPDLLKKLGQASWHIFLVQMSFFYFLWQPVQVILLNPMVFSLPPLVSIIMIPIGGAITVFICAGIGYAWYLAGEKIGSLRAS